MPLQTLLTILAIVIAFAAVTVAGLSLLTDSISGSQVMPLAAISIITLCASIVLRHFGKSDDKP